jgi:hypothetical protein
MRRAVSGPSGAAARLGIPGTTLESKIKALKVNKNRFKGTDPSKNSLAGLRALSLEDARCLAQGYGDYYNNVRLNGASPTSR